VSPLDIDLLQARIVQKLSVLRDSRLARIYEMCLTETGGDLGRYFPKKYGINYPCLLK